MKSGSVASVAVLLTLGVLAGVTLVREHTKGVMSESEDISIGSSIRKLILQLEQQKAARVQAVVDKLGLDDNRDLPRLYEYIMTQGWKNECPSGGKSCSVIAISFTVSSEGDAGTKHDLEYESSNVDFFKFVPKNSGETGMVAKKIDFPSEHKHKLEGSYTIRAKGTNAAKVRINWMFNRVWNAGANRNEFLVSVAPNNEGFNCYSKQKEYVGSTFCYKTWRFYADSDRTYPWTKPYSDPWDAFDNALISKRGESSFGNP